MFKLKVVKYFIIVLLKPKLDAREDSFLSKKKLDFVNCMTSHVCKTLNCLGIKNTQLSALNLRKYSDKNIDAVKIYKFLALSPIFKHRLNLLLSLYIINKIMYIGLEWHLYVNMQLKQMCNALCVIKKNKSCLILCHDICFIKIIAYYAKHLSIFNISLKSLKCIIWYNLSTSIHLDDINYISGKSCAYLFKPSKQSIMTLVNTIKQKLYHKNMQGYWRASKYICTPQALLSIEKALYLWLVYYSTLLSHSQVLKINKIIDRIFYKWQMK